MRAYAVLAVVVSLFLVACGDATSPGEEPEGVVDASGGVVTADNGKVRLEVPAGAVSGQTQITIERASAPAANPNLLPGTAYEFGPSGLQFTSPVTLDLAYDPAELPAGAHEQRLRIFKQVGSGWVLDAEAAGVDAAANRVRASIMGFSTHAVLHDPCATAPLSVGQAMSGQITQGDCLVGSSYQERFAVEAEATTAVRITMTSSELRASLGLTAPGRDVDQALAFAARTAPADGGSATMAVLAGPASYQVYAGGHEQSLGAYTLETAVLPDGENRLGCSEGMYVATPVSAAPQRLDDSNDCKVTIIYPSDPSVDGKQTLEEYYWIKVPAGRTATATTTRTGGEEEFTPFPTFFLGGGQVVQTSGSAVAHSKTISHTAPETRWLLLGVSATLRQGPDGLTYTRGTYDLSVTVE
jgi:hypothetical protein